jgi:hypothetical protein
LMSTNPVTIRTATRNSRTVWAALMALPYPPLTVITLWWSHRRYRREHQPTGTASDRLDNQSTGYDHNCGRTEFSRVEAADRY